LWSTAGSGAPRDRGAQSLGQPRLLGERDEFHPVVPDRVTAWLVVDVGTLVLGLRVWCVCCCAASQGGGRFAASHALFVVVVLIGLGNGIVVDQVNELPEAER
jgi:hypothetical protein